MAVKLRLTRRGKKKQPFYRIVATDSRTARDGKYLEKVGLYNPLPDPAEILIDEEKAFYWLGQGAVPSDTVKNLFSKKGIMLKWSLKKKGLDEAKVEEEYKKWEVIQLELQKKKEALAAQAKRESTDKDTEEQVETEETPAVAATSVEAPVETEETPAVAETPVEAPVETEEMPAIVETPVEVPVETEETPVAVESDVEVPVEIEETPVVVEANAEEKTEEAGDKESVSKA